MNLNQGLVDLVAVALVAALAPLVVAALPGPRIPQVVIFLLGGVLIGPHVLGVAETSNIQLLANIGLGFLFLLAGYELDPKLLRQQPGKLAITGWLISAVLAVGVAAGLTAAGYIKDYVPVGLALTTTALGTLLPILRDNDMLTGQFGQHVYAAGAVGELFPILIIAVFLTQRGHFVALASVALVGVLAIALSAAPWLARSSTVQRIIREGQDATGQTTLRWAVVLLFLLLAVASRFGLDVVLGAVLAGIVLRAWTRRFNMDTEGLERKFDAVGYGIFIPIFFISSGMTLDLKAISQDPLRLLLFFGLLLIVRGLPSLLVYRRTLARPATRRDDVHHRNHVAAADRPGRDRPAGRRHAPRHFCRPDRRGRAVGPGISPHRGRIAPVSAAHTRRRRDHRGTDGRRDQRTTGESQSARPRRLARLAGMRAASGDLPLAWQRPRCARCYLHATPPR